jgi:RNA polymerase sigma-70 factor (ECF subfamily)
MGLKADEVVQLLLTERLRVVAAAAVIVRDPSATDDLFQQVVLTALEHRDEIRDPGHLLSWALRAVRHRAIDLARRKRVRPLSTEVLDLLEADWGDPAAGANPDRVEALRHCLGKLGDPAQDLLRMKYFDGMTAVAIAQRLRRTADAVYQSLSRIHRALRACVTQELAQPTEAGCAGDSREFVGRTEP